MDGMILEFCGPAADTPEELARLKYDIRRCKGFITDADFNGFVSKGGEKFIVSVRSPHEFSVRARLMPWFDRLTLDAKEAVLSKCRWPQVDDLPRATHEILARDRARGFMVPEYHDAPERGRRTVCLTA